MHHLVSQTPLEPFDPFGSTVPNLGPDDHSWMDGLCLLDIDFAQFRPGESYREASEHATEPFMQPSTTVNTSFMPYYFLEEPTKSLSSSTSAFDFSALTETSGTSSADLMMENPAALSQHSPILEGTISDRTDLSAAPSILPSPHTQQTFAPPISSAASCSPNVLPDQEQLLASKKTKTTLAASGILLGSSNLISQLLAIIPTPLGTAFTNADGPITSTNSSEVEKRRSRAPIPSKCIEQMQNIGAKFQSIAPSSSTEKENLPPGVPPTWAVLAKDHLLWRDLGIQWSSCVKLWFDVEDILGYGTVLGTKVSNLFFFFGIVPNSHYLQSALPSISLRPEEWMNWVSKCRQGERNYHQTPVITDPAEFGIALVKWWNGMQPSVRQSPSGMPQPIGSTPTIPAEDWMPLRRAGPNGLVSVMTLLVWWGQMIESRTRWQEDSQELWTTMVSDVSGVLQVLKAVGAPKKRKSGGGGKENAKRYVFQFCIWSSNDYLL